MQVKLIIPVIAVIIVIFGLTIYTNPKECQRREVVVEGYKNKWKLTHYGPDAKETCISGGIGANPLVRCTVSSSEKEPVDIYCSYDRNCKIVNAEY